MLIRSSQKQNTRSVYHNYQFYEMEALLQFLKNQEAEGYYLCKVTGRFGSLLKFSRLQDEERSEQDGLRAWSRIRELSDASRGIRIMKDLVLTWAFFLLAVVGLAVKIFAFRVESLAMTECGICASILVIFLLYFIGDVHDTAIGKGKLKNQELYFRERSKCKEVLFTVGDISRWMLFLLCAIGSIFLLVSGTYPVTLLELARMWMIYAVISVIWRLRLRNSYALLPVLAAFLIIL